ncbi:hypothetical protein EJ08DRAFT_266029 [Tothia fuscella]|uniref:Uncharacterized protein n=1 Tax=Tothia fuscella TaxID=1048955 RepID=A0A9P4NQC7_9PEZI|nr:hypothetical protein EJ08DRAFT_266029 [Tothia fuscella]
MRGPPPPGGPSRGWRGATNVGMDVRHVDAQSYPWSRPTPTSGFGIRPNSVSGFQVRQSFRQCGAANVNQSTRASSHALINSAGRGGPNGAQLRHQPYARTTRSTTAQNHIHPHLHPQQRFGTILQPETNNGAPVRSTPLNSLTHLTFRADSTNSSIPTTVAVKSKRCKRGVVTKSSASSNPVPTPIAGHQRPAVNFVTLDIPLGEYPIRPRTTRVLLPGQALQARIRPEFRKVSMVTTPKYFRLPKIPDMVTDPPLPKLRPAEFVREDVPEVQLPPAFFWLLDSKNPNYLLYVDDSRFPMDNLGPWEQQWLNNAFRADKGGLTRPTPARILGIPR